MSLLKVAVPAAAAAVAAAVWWRHWRRSGSKLGGDAAVGVIGLGVMGAQLLMNLAEKLETPIAGLDMDDGKAKAAIELAQSEGGLPVCTFTHTAAFVAALRKPRVVLLLVPAGRAVDGACAALSELLERGDLVVDMRGLAEMRAFAPTFMDLTHSLQQPNQDSGVTGGRPELISTVARAAVAAGVDGVFIETHPDPSKALSDGANMLPLDQLEGLLTTLSSLHDWRLTHT